MDIITLNASLLPAYIAAGGLIFIIWAWTIAFAVRVPLNKLIWRALFYYLPRLSIFFLLLSLVFGQLIRFPLPGQGGGLLISDLALVMVIMSAVFNLLKLWITDYLEGTPSEQITSYFLLLSFLPFLVWSLFSLSINSYTDLDFHSSVIAFSYWLRIAFILFLLPALLTLFKDDKLARFALRGFLASASTLVFLGFLQLIFFPDLSWLASRGWDPHQHRLLSTWFDPNFFGGFLAVTLPFFFTAAFYSRSSAHKPQAMDYGLRITSFFAFLALLLTQSRSAWLAFFVSILIFLPILISKALKRLNPKQLFIGTDAALFLLLVTVVVLGAFWPRVYGLISPDATVNLRLDSLKRAWPLAEENLLIGVGYNTYQFAARQTGLISNYAIHSRAGTDNSLLNLLITTGVIGSLLFLTPWAYLVFSLHGLWRRGRALAGAAIFSVFVIFIQSQFINALFYSHLLITVMIIISFGLASFHHD